MKQSEALDILKMGKNVFLTGAAGAGKTYVLNQYIAYLRKNGAKVGVTASTGIAATHMNGVTIHSWSGIGIKTALSKKDIEKISKRSYIKKHFRGTEVLVIDEVSMLHDYGLDMVDMMCRAVKEKDEPFGGMQVIFCGDFFQLPPVSKEKRSETHFVYHSESWKNAGLHVCYLDEQYRADDDELLNVLNDIRENRVEHETLEPLRKRYRKKVIGNVEPVKLYTHNVDVDRINQEHLVTLPGLLETYEMVGTGKEKALEFLRKNCLAPETLQLKRGARVMFVKNNYDLGYVNGTLGQVVGFDEVGYPIVETKEGKEIVAMPETWVLGEEGEVIAEVSQVPLRLAWAITVHKSQGMSLDAAEMDLSHTFEPGMGYVALSRVRTLDGLKLLGWGQMAGIVNSEVLEFDKDFRKASSESQKEIKAKTKEEIGEAHRVFLDRVATIAKKEKKRSTYDLTRDLVVKKMSVEEIAKERELTTGAILSHLEKLHETDPELDLSYLKPPAKRMKKIREAFKGSDDMKLSPARSKLGSGYSFDELRLARIFI